MLIKLKVDRRHNGERRANECKSAERKIIEYKDRHHPIDRRNWLRRWSDGEFIERVFCPCCGRSMEDRRLGKADRRVEQRAEKPDRRKN